MIRLTYTQFIDCIYSSDPIGEYESILESLRGNRELTGDNSELLDQCITESLVEFFNSEDDGFSDDFIEEDYRDPFFDDHNVQDFPL